MPKVYLRKITPPILKAALCLGHLRLSMAYATTTSSKEIADVSAATHNSRKNNADHIWPPGINANTFGSVMKVSPGPALVLLQMQILLEKLQISKKCRGSI